MSNRFAMAAAFAAAIALLSSCGGGEGETDTTRSHPVAASPNPLASDFALFRAAPTARDELPEDLLLPGFERGLRLGPGSTRLALSGPNGRFYAFWSKRGVVCLVGTDEITSNCWPTGTVTAGNAAATAMCSYGLPPRTMQMFGLVPDGVKTVTLLYTDGSQRLATVDRNAYVIRIPYTRALPLRLRWTRAGKPHTQISGIIPSAARKACGESS